jgi:hypothetical protein
MPTVEVPRARRAPFDVATMAARLALRALTAALPVFIAACYGVAY